MIFIPAARYLSIIFFILVVPPDKKFGVKVYGGCCVCKWEPRSLQQRRRCMGVETTMIETDMATINRMMKRTMKTATTITMKMTSITIIWKEREIMGGGGVS